MIKRFKETSKLRIALYFITLFSYATIHWIDVTFGRPSLDQIVFHILSWANNPTTFNLKLVLQFVIIFSAICFLISYFLVQVEKKLLRLIQSRPSRFKKIANAAIREFPVFMLFLSILGGFLIFDGSSVVYKRQYRSFIHENYNPPIFDETKKTNKKNLIHIYIEGFGSAFSDVDYFGEDLASGLNSIKNGIQFEKFRQVSGTGWTAASIMATQCGVPLIDVVKDRVCLGDLLKDAGYHNVFMGGADADFTEKKSFFSKHGYEKVYGLGDWKKISRFHPHDFNELGLSDTKLFEEVKVEVLRLNKLAEPFNLTVLTLDTHGSGLDSAGCKVPFKSERPIANKAKCVDQLITSFVSWVFQNTPKESTRIVIHGDHTGVFPYPTIDRIDRTVFNLFVANDESEKRKPCSEEILHFDFAPTILSFIGFHLHNEIYGLGINQLCDGTNFDPESLVKRDKLIRNRNLFFFATKSILGQPN